MIEELERHPFTPAWWLPGRHLQTVWGPLVRKRWGHIGAPHLRHECWDTPDDDFLDLFFLDGDADKPVVVLFHGMEGSPQSYYIPGFARQFFRLGWTFTVMFFRSCGVTANRTPRLYHLGATEDPEFVIRKLRERFPERALLAIGISLGGNVLSVLLGKLGDAAIPLLDAASIISAPYDPVTTAPHFHKELFGLYVHHFLRTLKPKALELCRHLPGLLDEEQVKAAQDFYHFDTVVTARLNGFRDAEDYWTKTACIHYLDRIRIPTLLISSSDDPFVLPESLPRTVASQSPYLYPQFTDHGGHAGFAYGACPCRPRYWYEDQTIRFFQAQWALQRSSPENRCMLQRGQSETHATELSPPAML